MAGPTSDSARVAAWIVAVGGVGYAVVALLVTHPLALDPFHALISVWPRDAAHSLWTQWWFGRALSDSSLSLFHTDWIRYPDGANLQLADINLAVNALTWPLERSLGPIAAYNAMLWGSFVASGWLFWRLARRLAGGVATGWVAGLAFASSTYWISCALNSWSYLVHTWVLPLIVLAIGRARERGRLADYAVAGIVVGLAFHVTPYYFLYAVSVLAVLAVFSARPLKERLSTRAGAIGIGLGGLCALAVVAPRAVPMLQASVVPQAVHSGQSDLVLASRLPEFVWPWLVRPDRLVDGTYLVVFLGYTQLAVVAVGWAVSDRRAAYTKWLVTAAVMFVLALGPTRDWVTNSGTVELKLPGYWLGRLPGFSSMTNDWRWSYPGGFCLAIAFAFGLADCRRRWPRARPSLPGAVALALLFEVVWVFPFPRSKPLLRYPPDPISLALRDADGVEAIIDFRHHAKIHQLTHGKRIVGGWLPRVEQSSVDRTQRLLADLRGRPGREQVAALGALGIGALVVDDETAYRIVAGDDAGAFELKPIRAR